MKQHISVEDIEKFSNDQQIKVASVFGQYGNCCNTGGESINIGKLVERITIGEMIEVLGKKMYSMTQVNETYNWHIVIGDWNGKRIVKPSLCDALWEAIKQNLSLDADFSALEKLLTKQKE